MGIRIVEAANTLIPALKVLRDKGFALTRGGWPAHDGESCFVARRANQEFIAEDPLRLLGLLSIAEAFGNQWQDVCGDEEFEELLALINQDDEEGQADTDPPQSDT